jgi:hypothetical protein
LQQAHLRNESLVVIEVEDGGRALRERLQADAAS